MMIHQHGNDFELYKKKLKELGPVLNKLGEFTEIIWLNHYPTVDSYVADVNRTVDIYEEIIQRYNEAVMRIFKWETKTSYKKQLFFNTARYFSGIMIVSASGIQVIYWLKSMFVVATFFNATLLVITRHRILVVKTTFIRVMSFS